MVGIEQVDDVKIEILLKPDDIRLGSVEDLSPKTRESAPKVASKTKKKKLNRTTHLDNPRISQHLSKLAHPASHLWHHQIHHPILAPFPTFPSRANLHQTQEASVRPERVMFEIDRDVGLGLQPGDQLPQTSESGDVGERDLFERGWRSRRGWDGSEEGGRVRDVGEFVRVRVRRRRRRSFRVGSES